MLVKAHELSEEKSVWGSSYSTETVFSKTVSYT